MSGSKNSINSPDKGSAAIEKVQAYLLNSKFNQENLEKLSEQECNEALSFICNGAAVIAQAKDEIVYQQHNLQKYSKEKLISTGINALVSLQDNLIFLDAKNVPECQPYKDIFKNILIYLAYIKLVGTEEEYKAAVSKLKPVVEQLVLDITQLRMSKETEKERKENIEFYNKHHTSSVHENASVKLMNRIYQENERIKDIRREKVIAAAIENLNHYIERNESEHELCFDVYEGDEISEVEESLVVARKLKKDLEDNNFLVKDRVSIIENAKTNGDTPVEIKELLKVITLSIEISNCLDKLKKSGAESADNKLHDKYRVVKKISEVIDCKSEYTSPGVRLNNVKTALEARNYGVKNRKPYRESFNRNEQPSGMEILTTRRHPVLDRFISVIKQIFTFDRINSHNSDRSSRSVSDFFNRPLSKTKTLAAIPALNLSEETKPKPMR